MWEGVFTKNAQKALLNLDYAIQERIERKIEWLVNNFEAIKPQRLSGQLSHLYKLRVGDYRVIYSIDSEEHIIYIMDLGHRRDIYK